MNNRYIVEREFEHSGYKCVVAFGFTGHRCGYVGIPKSHSLYGKGYQEHLDIKKADIGHREISGVFPLLGAYFDEDERIRIEAYFQCHGGITFANGGENSHYPIDSDLWWFGFDCGHAGDKPDLKYAIEKFPYYVKELRVSKQIEDLYPNEGGVIRTEQYVANECKKLAEQLKEFE